MIRLITFTLLMYSLTAFAAPNCRIALGDKYKNTRAEGIFSRAMDLDKNISLYLMLMEAEGSTLQAMVTPTQLRVYQAQANGIVDQLEQVDVATADLSGLDLQLQQVESQTRAGLELHVMPGQQQMPFGYKARNLPGSEGDWVNFPRDTSTQHMPPYSGKGPLPPKP